MGTFIPFAFAGPPFSISEASGFTEKTVVHNLQTIVKHIKSVTELLLSLNNVDEL